MNERDWQDILTENPKILWGVVADVVKAIKANEGERKTGRRPAVMVSSLDELYTLLFPQHYTTEPFPQAFREALGGRSQRLFAQETGFHQGTLSKLLSGKLEPTPVTIECVAYALGRPPSYFAEYRALKLAELVCHALLENPDLTADLLRRTSVSA